MLNEYNIILVIARIYPLIIQILSFLLYFMKLDIDFLILESQDIKRNNKWWIKIYVNL